MPTNSHVVQCKTLVDNPNIDGTSICGPDVEFDSTPEIGGGVLIGHGGEFGKHLEVGESTMIGEFVTGEDDVILGDHVCVQNATFLKEGLKVNAYAMVQTMGTKDSTVTEAAPDSMFVLWQGECQTRKR